MALPNVQSPVVYAKLMTKFLNHILKERKAQEIDLKRECKLLKDIL